MTQLNCHGEKNCTGAVTYIDEKGFIYCTIHGAIRRMYRRSRKLKPNELKRLQAGLTIKKF